MARTRIGRGNALAAPCLAALVAAAPAAGQTATEHGVYTTVGVQGSVGVDSPWRWSSDVLVSARDGTATPDVLAAQLLVSRRVTPGADAAVGYVYAEAFNVAGSLREHRFVQQYTWSAGLKPRVSIRGRIEERLVSGRDDVLVRVRKRVRVTWPLHARGGLHAVVGEELFLQPQAASGGLRLFESNEVFAGVRRRLTPRSTTEVGYLNVYARGGSGRARRSHMAAAMLQLAL